MPLPPDMPKVIRLLREMHRQQVETDDLGQREIAWYYWSGDIEEALGLDPGTITGEESDAAS